MIDYKAIGRRIAFYRKKASMTQSTLSEKLGVTESYISQLERGSAKIPLPRLGLLTFYRLISPYHGSAKAVSKAIEQGQS